jgi:hypothetical protein
VPPIRLSGQGQEPHHDSPDIGVQDGIRLVESQAQDSRGRIGSEPGEGAQRFIIPGNPASMLADHKLRRRVKVSGTLIIAQPLPSAKDFLKRGAGQCLDVREKAQPFIIIRDDGADRSLLEHDLRDPYPVGIPGLSPWEIAAVNPVPCDERPGYASRRQAFFIFFQVPSFPAPAPSNP